LIIAIHNDEFTALPEKTGAKVARIVIYSAGRVSIAHPRRGEMA
jgi:hypothetical protein